MNSGKSGQMALQTRPHIQNQAIGWLRKGCSSPGGRSVVRFPVLDVIWGMSVELILRLIDDLRRRPAPA